MRLTVRLLGRELLNLELYRHQDTEQAEAEHGVPFGFSGGASVQAELAGDWIPAEEGRA